MHHWRQTIFVCFLTLIILLNSAYCFFQFQSCLAEAYDSFSHTLSMYHAVTTHKTFTGTFGVAKNLLSFQGRLHRPLAEEEGTEAGDAPTPWHRRLQFTGSINFFLTVWFILG